jgi:hypothetical protein
MQLLDSLTIEFSDIPDSLQLALQDIVNHVEIDSRHCIKHPKYKTVDLPETVIANFQKLPLDIQSRHLSLELRNFLYSAYYNGSWENGITNDTEGTNSTLKQTLENNSLFGVDLAFHDRLHTSNKGTGYWSHDWLIIKEETDGSLAVHKNGLTLHIERNLHLRPEDQAANIGNSIAIKMPKNLMQSAFYMAVSNTGNQGYQDIVRIYFNLTPEGAVAVMDNLTTQLNAISVPFSFKALFNPSDYKRYDSAVLYFNKHKYPDVQPILERVYTENQSYFYQQTPLFTKLLAPGLACAEEPDHKFGEQESFGTNRCQIIAHGLLNAWQQGNDTPANRIESILKHFALHKIDLQRPYLNTNSEDIYTFFSN